MTQIKTKERVKELAEVFTAQREVNDMLDLMTPYFTEITSTFFEPACGNGNFLVSILERKLQLIKDNIVYQTALALTTIYGVDISQENIDEAKTRLFQIAKNYIEFNGLTLSKQEEHTLLKILDTNILLGNTIDHPENIIFTSYIPDNITKMWTLKTFRLSEMLNNNHTPIEIKPPTLYNTI